jgi:hypothetical protein
MPTSCCASAMPQQRPARPGRRLARTAAPYRGRVVLADHAPTAILAARTLDIPVMLFGSGFFAPPPVHPTPNMRPWSPCPANSCSRLTASHWTNINAVLEACRKPPLDFLAQLFQVAEDSLLSFPELDHYPARGPARYWGMLPAAVAEDSTWPAGARPARVLLPAARDAPCRSRFAGAARTSRQHPDLRARPAGRN